MEASIHRVTEATGTARELSGDLGHVVTIDLTVDKTRNTITIFPKEDGMKSLAATFAALAAKLLELSK